MSVAVVVVLAVGIAACSGVSGSDDQAPTQDPETIGVTGPAAGVEQVDATLIQPRYLQTRRMIAVSLTNHGTSPVRFERFQLSAPLFATVAPTPRDTTLEAGARLDIPIDYGEVQCEPPEGEPVVITGIRGADRSTRRACRCRTLTCWSGFTPPSAGNSRSGTRSTSPSGRPGSAAAPACAGRCGCNARRPLSR
ncbi:MAG: hypothetical protein GEU81_07225 [Nitriliruptorales bacterium]|nr:hypothetical protein [Nitriliruptorales bacterium]